MKVAMIETGGWGGIAHYAWNLCEALASQQTEVWLLTNMRYELDAIPRRFHVVPCFASGIGYLRSMRRLIQQLKALAPDIVHVQSFLSTRFDAFLWPHVRRRVPVVMTVHNVHSHEYKTWEDWTMWRCLRVADAVVVHTRESAALVSRRLGAAAKVQAIHHGDYAFFAGDVGDDRVAARSRLELPADGFLLLAFGAIRPYKGLHDLIAALPQIRRHYSDVRLVIAGPLLVGTEAEYREAIRRASVTDAVIFRPHYVPHSQVATYFTAADVAVYNYREVTDSGSLRIACSLGRPVVATTVGAFREFLTDGVTGRLVPPDAPALLAIAICDVLSDPAGAAGMAAAARVLASSRWAWADSAKATLEMYRAILRSISFKPHTPPPYNAVRGGA